MEFLQSDLTVKSLGDKQESYQKSAVDVCKFGLITHVCLISVVCLELYSNFIDISANLLCIVPIKYEAKWDK